MNHRKFARIVLLALAVIPLLALLLCRDTASREMAEQPTLKLSLIATETATVDPTFVGRDVCQKCHAENHKLHGQSGHAKTFAWTRNSAIAQKFDGQTIDSGDPWGSFHYSMNENGLSVKRLNDPDDTVFPLEYVVGSGHRAITLLTLLGTPDAEPTGIEHRISWFHSLDKFGRTPGHELETPQKPNEFFGKTVHGKTLEDCVRCHTTTGTVVGRQIVELAANVNCEKCHGPGSEHVRQANSTPSPSPYSIGRDEWDGESEIQLCGSCHRLPNDLPLQALREYPDMITRFQPVGMLRSKCFLESEGKMTCTTCHNPHMAAEAKPKLDYDRDCIQCHLENSSSHVACPVSPHKDCVECHMPPIDFEQGISFHDHWIRVRTER